MPKIFRKNIRTCNNTQLLTNYILLDPVSCAYLMMDSDCDSDIVPNFIESIEIDLDDDLGFSNESESD